MKCTNGRHIKTDPEEKDHPCDFAVIAARELPGPKGSISLTWHFGHFNIEAILYREHDGKPWYPTLDEEWFTEEDTEAEALTVFETMFLKWKDVTPTTADAEAF